MPVRNCAVICAPIIHNGISRPEKKQAQIITEKFGLKKLEEMCKWNPQILVSTIHHVKGGEATNCAIMLDTTRRTIGNVFNNIDEELRILYVGVTRTKQNLFLIDSQNGQGYDNILQVIKEENHLEW